MIIKQIFFSLNTSQILRKNSHEKSHWYLCAQDQKIGDHMTNPIDAKIVLIYHILKETDIVMEWTGLIVMATFTFERMFILR